MRILVALGGNALIRCGEPADAETRRHDVEDAVAGLAAVAAEHDLVIAHGDGPLLELALRNHLPDRDFATLLTETIVDLGDPAFAEPSKPIGPVYTAFEAARLRADHGWTVGRDGDAWRRLVPSPEPRAITELRAIRLLVDAGVLVVCAGGGGIPVAVGADGKLRGVEGVVDEDLTAALLARRLKCDLLLLLTDVDAVYLGWGSAQEHPLRRSDPDSLRAMGFAAGSMGPKVEAAGRFAEATGRPAAIGALADAAAIVRGEAGTRISESLVEAT